MIQADLRPLDLPFDFRRQPAPLPAALDPWRRVPLALMLVAKSHGSGASWKGLQLLNWAVRDPAHIELLVAVRHGTDVPGRPVVRFEPALDRALDIGVGLGLLEQRHARVFRLTEDGRRVLEQLDDSDAFAQEREMLTKLSSKITQKEVKRVLEWRDA